MRVSCSGKFCHQFGRTLGEGTALILVGVPSHEVDLFQELLHGLEFVEVAAVQVARVPFNQTAKVKITAVMGVV